jgi:hypothetical protein
MALGGKILDFAVSVIIFYAAFGATFYVIYILGSLRGPLTFDVLLDPRAWW